jgi:transcriptional regulator with XRE-family HTH domain
MSREKHNKLIAHENDTIGARLRQFAKANFGTIRKLAELLEMSEENLSQYTRGKSKPGSDILSKLNALGCDLNWLITGKEGSDAKEMFNTTYNYLKKVEEENKKLKKKLAVFEKASKYFDDAKNIDP